MLLPVALKIFTFQYGSTQILNAFSMINFRFHLHSNMVLLKSEASPSKVMFKIFTFQYGSTQIFIPLFLLCECTVIYIPIWFYSNAYIQSTTLNITDLHSNMVLLKYVRPGCTDVDNWIYIPIWFYSNLSNPIPSWSFKSIYIPIWFYSNEKENNYECGSNCIYIPIWFYSNPTHSSNTFISAHLHSNMVLLK